PCRRVARRATPHSSPVPLRRRHLSGLPGSALHYNKRHMIPLHRRLSDAYSGHVVCVTGGASFIGSHLVDSLLHFGADVVIVDDFSSGRRANIPTFPPDQILELDLADRAATLDFFPDAE